MGGQYSVENTKKLLDFVFVTAFAVKQAGADGKYGVEDLGQLVPVFVAAGQDFQNVSMVPKELGELDEHDAGEIVAFAQVKLPGVVDKATLILKINAALAVALAVVKLVSVLQMKDTVAQVNP